MASARKESIGTELVFLNQSAQPPVTHHQLRPVRPRGRLRTSIEIAHDGSIILVQHLHVHAALLFERRRSYPVFVRELRNHSSPAKRMVSGLLRRQLSCKKRHE